MKPSYVVNQQVIFKYRGVDAVHYILELAWLIICFGIGAYWLNKGLNFHKWVGEVLPLLIFFQIVIYYCVLKAISAAIRRLTYYYNIAQNSLLILNTIIPVLLFEETEGRPANSMEFTTLSSSQIVII